MTKVSRELALEYVHESPFGQEMLGMYESLATRGGLSPRAELVGEAIHVSMVSELRATSGIGVNRKTVAFFTNGEFINVRVRDGREEKVKDGIEIGFEPGVIFAFETGTFDRDMRRIGGIEIEEAPFNGKVLRPSSHLYTAESLEAKLYQQSLPHMERALVRRLGNTNKIRFLN